MITIHTYTTQFERSPNSISSYSVNSGLTEWIKAVLIQSDRELEIKLYTTGYSNDAHPVEDDTTNSLCKGSDNLDGHFSVDPLNVSTSLSVKMVCYDDAMPFILMRTI